MRHLLIVGGSDAGISAGLRARELDPGCEVTIVMADCYPNYSICGLPFYLSGEVPDWHALAHQTAEEITSAGIHLLLDHHARSIDVLNHEVTVVGSAGLRRMPYDRLVIATGAAPVHPEITGLGLPGVFLLRTMTDSFVLHQRLSEAPWGRAVIIGGGYIGLEMADALTRRGYTVSVVEHHP